MANKERPNVTNAAKLRNRFGGALPKKSDDIRPKGRSLAAVTWAICLLHFLSGANAEEGVPLESPLSPQNSPQNSFRESDETRDFLIPDALVAVRLSEELVQRRFNRPVVRDSPVHEIILGANVQGWARTQGHLSLEFAESTDAAQLYFVFKGTSVARTVARQSAVLIHTTTTTHFSARKRLMLDLPEGFQHAPAEIDARTQRTTTAIQPLVPGLRGCLARKIASRRLAENAGVLNAISSSNSRDRIRTSFNAAAQEKLEYVNQSLWIIAPALQEMRRVRGRQLDLYTSDSSLLLVLRLTSEAAAKIDAESERTPRGLPVSRLRLTTAPVPATRAQLTMPITPAEGALAEVWIHSSWGSTDAAALQPVFFGMMQILLDVREEAREKAALQGRLPVPLRSKFRRLTSSGSNGIWTAVELHEDRAALLK